MGEKILYNSNNIKNNYINSNRGNGAVPSSLVDTSEKLKSNIAIFSPHSVQPCKILYVECNTLHIFQDLNLLSLH